MRCYATSSPREGYLVSTVEDGREALDAVTTFQPEVILVDMVMPGLSAIDVLAALRRAGVTVPVVLISGQVIVREGFFGVLSKPFEFRRVAELVMVIEGETISTFAAGPGRAVVVTTTFTVDFSCTLTVVRWIPAVGPKFHRSHPSPLGSVLVVGLVTVPSLLSTVSVAPSTGFP